MKNFELKGVLRKNVGKTQTKQLRREEKVPCVLYGGKENIHFSVLENDLRHLVYTADVYFVNLDLDGKKYKSILHDLQFHPVTDKILHMDFVELFDDKPLNVKLPIKLSGNSIGIKDGGKLRWKRRDMKVKALPNDLPDFLEIDITDLEIGQTIKVGDLNFDNITILDPFQSMVVAVVSSRIAAKGMELAEDIKEEEVEGEEGEEAPEGAEAPEGKEGEAKKEETTESKKPAEEK